MNVYEKLLQARIKLQESPIKKTGKNTGLKFDYFELADFLPTINQINAELKIASMFSIVENVATLTMIDAEKPEDQIIFTSPTAEAKLQGGASPIQCLGSQHTYMRRYLYLLAYEIIENDVLDAQTGSQQEKPQQTTNTSSENKLLSQGQIARLYAIAKTKGRTGDQVQAAVKSHYKIEHMNELTKQQYDEVVKKYEAIADVEEVKGE